MSAIQPKVTDFFTTTKKKKDVGKDIDKNGSDLIKPILSRAETKATIVNVKKSVKSRAKSSNNKCLVSSLSKNSTLTASPKRKCSSSDIKHLFESGSKKLKESEEKKEKESKKKALLAEIEGLTESIVKRDNNKRTVKKNESLQEGDVSVAPSPTKVSAWLLSEERRNKLFSHPDYQKYKNLIAGKNVKQDLFGSVGVKENETASVQGSSRALFTSASPKQLIPSSPCKSLRSPYKSYLSSPSKTIISPTKSSLNNLAPSSPTKDFPLRLPLHYKQLEITFDRVDYVVSLLHKRQELATFDKVKVEVQRLTRRDFNHTLLGQIMSVMPHAFRLRYDNLSNSPKLILDWPINSNLTSIPTFLFNRRKCFSNLLLEITKEYHKAFLASLDPPIELDHSQLSKWHDEFDLNKVDHIVPIANIIPNAPTLKINVTSVEGFLEKTRVRLGMINEEKQEKSKCDNQVTNQKIDMKTSAKIENGPLKRISVALLEKIRAKEARNLVKEMTRKPEDERELNMINRLPAIIRIIHSYFVGQKKLAIPLEDVIIKTVNSYDSCISTEQVSQHISLMVKLLKTWIVAFEHKSRTYIKIINLKKNINELEDELQQHANRIRRA